jgi:hypothetical protein
MLKTISVSKNRKTGPIAVTYRAGEHHTYATCPKSCGLHPAGEHGAELIDPEYLAALLAAVPRNGQAWTYSHFPAALLPIAKAGETVINASCDSMDDAVAAFKLGRPATVAAPVGTSWAGGVEYKGVKFVRCPAELAENFTCAQCGNGRPLCAQSDREYVIVFVAHGPSAAKVGKATPGGCYAAGGPVGIAWHGTRKNGRADDAAALREFARSLPPGSLLRHHVAGDIGRAA